jgi:hypothetical protein
MKERMKKDYSNFTVKAVHDTTMMSKSVSNDANSNMNENLDEQLVMYYVRVSILSQVFLQKIYK